MEVYVLLCNLLLIYLTFICIDGCSWVTFIYTVHSMPLHEYSHNCTITVKIFSCWRTFNFYPVLLRYDWDWGFPGDSSGKDPAWQCRRCKRQTQVRSLSWEDPLKEGMATLSSNFAWRISWTEEPDGLQSIGSQGVLHNWRVLAHSTHNWNRILYKYKVYSIMT